VSPEAAAVSDVRPRLQRRRRQTRRQRAKLAGLVAAIVALLVAAIWLAVFSPVFAADRVEVSGVHQLTVEEVTTAAAVPLGEPLLRLDVDAIHDRVAALAPVDQVTVSRRWSGVVAIAVVERTPVYGLVSPNGISLVDRSGLIYYDVAEPPVGLLLVTMPEPTDRLRADTATVVAAWPESLRVAVAQLTVTSSDHIELTLITGATVFWGSADQSDLKAEVAATLVATVPASYYDVSAPAFPATRP
jgi:cell division protein FtsQ